MMVERLELTLSRLDETKESELLIRVTWKVVSYFVLGSSIWMAGTSGRISSDPIRLVFASSSISSGISDNLI